MNKQFKRVISLALALLITLAFLPATTTAAADEGRATISSHGLIGTWVKEHDPAKAYDGSTSTRWNPQSSGFESGEGIIFTLDKEYDLSKIQITVGSRYHYFGLYGSADGMEYTTIAEVNADNQDSYYTVSGDVYTFVADGLSASQVKYVKILFTGNSAAQPNAFVNFDEIVIYGTEYVPAEPEGLEQATITANSLVGNWVNNGDPTKSYDGEDGTKWNPQTGGFSSEASIVYTLDKYYDIYKVVLTFSNRLHYVTISSSFDGENFTQLATIDSGNAASYYTDLVCTVSGLDGASAKYLKITYIGTENGTAWLNVMENRIYGTEAQGDKATITANSLVGNWVSNGDPTMSYDGYDNTKWNPQTGGFSSEASIVYTLDQSYDLMKLELVFGTRLHYVTVSVSSDNESFTTVATINSGNAASYYTDLTCVINGITAPNVRYVKIRYTGTESGTAWLNVMETKVYGVAAQEETVEAEKATISAGAVGGAWYTENTKDDSGNLYKAYDGNTGTKWNPTAKNFASNEHAVFTLDKAYDLTKIVITVASRYHFFTLYGSSDGVLYTQLADINADNYTQYYLSGYVCTVSDLSLENVKYLKVMVNGSPLGTANCYVNFQEIEIYGFASAAVTDAVSVAGWSLTLGDDIGVNFYLNAADISGAQASITVAGVTTDYALSTPNADGYYVVTADLAAAQMTEAVTLTLSKDGEVISTKSYSVYDYAQYVLDDVNNIFDEKTENLVREMLNYGAKAQSYFEYDAPAVKEYYLASAAASDVAEAAQMAVSGSIDGLSLYGASLVLKSKTSVRVYFEGDITGCTFTVNGTACEIQTKGEQYYVEIADINPQQLGEQFTVVATDANGNEISVSYGPLNYMARMSQNGSDSLKSLVKALYNYYLAAQAYIA